LKFGWMEDSRFLERVGNTIVVEFPPSVEAKTQTPFWPQAVRKIEECLSAHLGARITLESRFTGEEPPLTPEPELSPPLKRDIREPLRSQSPHPTPPEPSLPSISAEELASFKNDPLIRKALEIFNAEILISPQTN